MAAMSWFKLVFVAIVAGGAMQNAFAAPSKVENQNSVVAAVPPELQIIGKTVVEMSKVFGEFVNDVSNIILASVAKETFPYLLRIYPKLHATITASGLDDVSLGASVDEYKEYRIVAKAAMRLRQRLDTMERFEELLESTCKEAADRIFISQNIQDRSAVTGGMNYFYTRLDKRLKEHPQLRSTYLQVRESIAKEYKNVDLNLVEWSKLNEITISTQVIHKMMIVLTNKQFVYHAYRRLFMNEEYFVFARSTLELAKKSNNLETVQRIYDESLAEAAPTEDSVFLTIWDLQKALFGKLKEKFEKSSALNHELRIIQKNVGEKHDFDRKNIFDLDIMPW